MLSKLVGASLLTAAFTAVGGSVAIAAPSPTPSPPVQVTGDYLDGQVTTTVTDPGSGATLTSVGSTSDVSCTWSPDDTDNSILQSADPSSAAAAQYAQGARYYNIVCSDGTVYPGVFVPGDAGGAGRVTAEVLARSLTRRLPLPLPVAQHNPPGDATTGLAVWLWVPSAQWHALTQRTQVGPVWAEVTATPVATSWDPGDGSEPVVCSGPGTAYDRSRPAEQQSTDCSYTYQRSSAGQPQSGSDPNDRFYTVTVSVDWRITWVGAGGTAGALPDLQRTTSFTLRVADRETVVTSGNG